MRVAVVVLALVACAAASALQEEVPLIDSSIGAYEAARPNQPVIIVRKTTYYEPELVAVVVEKGVDDIPEETVLIQNYADVLGASNNEIRLCAVDNNSCLETPVTKFLVPSLFQSIGQQNGFKKFFEHAKDVPWIATLDDTVKLVNPVLSPKTSGPKHFSESPNVHSLESFKPIQVVSSDIFKYIPEAPIVPEYRAAVYPPPNTGISSVVKAETSQTIPVPYEVSKSSYNFPSSAVFQSNIQAGGVLPSNIQAGFAPLEQISAGGAFLGGKTTRAAYQQTPSFYGAPFLRAQRAITPVAYF